MRFDKRKNSEIRPLSFQLDVIDHAEGSVEVRMGKTKVICTATLEENVPKWLQNTEQGWISAEYSMLPRSTSSRIRREKAFSSGRSQEISRLIGRALRSSVDLKKLKEKQILIDCDVIQADGGTRTASINGGFLALSLALKFLHDQKQIDALPLKNYVAAVSLGIQGSEILVDLDYNEDVGVDVDMNFVMNEKEEFIEIQGTSERKNFDEKKLQEMIKLSQKACEEIFKSQEKIISSFFPLKK